MILRDQGDTLRVVTQTDHAHWGYLLLSAWPALGDHPRRAAILRATRQHDRGWQGIDASPVIDENGRPHDFRSLPTFLREDVWNQTVDRNLWPSEAPSTVDEAMEMWAEMLIAQHAWRVHRPGPSGLPGSIRHSEELLPLATQLAAERRERLQWIQQNFDQLSPFLGLQEPERDLERDDSWVRTLDFISLVVCHGWTEARDFVVETTDSRGSESEFRFSAEFAKEHLVLSPNPLKGTVRVPLRCRETENRTFESNRAWAMTLARTPWSSREISVGGSMAD